MKEVFIEIRGKKISLQGPGIGQKKEKALKILEDAAKALRENENKTEIYGNEIVIHAKTEK